MLSINDNSFAFIILEGYIIASINTVDCSNVFDSHARNNFGMNDSSCTAVVMKCDDVSQLEQYLCSLSVNLNVECFEVLPVEFYTEHSKTKCISASNVGENSPKRKRFKETVFEKEKRQYKYELFHINFTSFHCTGRYKLNKLTSLPMCGFIAQLVEHRTGIRGGHGFESR